MAFSKSSRKGQFPTSCNVCDVETKISWKCVDCNILMCNRCKEMIHPKIRNAVNHKVKDIKEIGQSEDVDFKNIPCKMHEGQVCLLLCMACDQLVCLKCIAKIHNGHRLGEISDGYITLQVIKEYNTNISKVLFMSLSEDSMWISDHDIIQKLQPEENHLRVISTVDVKIIGMYITPSDDLLIAPFRESVLKQISSKTNKLTDTKYSVAPLIFTAVYITSEGKVIVGARNPGEPFPATGRRTVIMMDKKGKNTATYEYDRNNQPLFTLPQDITTTNTGNICVVDILSTDVTGRVVVLGKDGDVLNIYTGHLDVNTEDKPFQPTTIVTTPSDNIIIPNLNIGIIHILNNVGHLKTHINTRNFGIQYPYSIAFNLTGNVYIGCTTAKDSTDKAKLYEVKLL